MLFSIIVPIYNVENYLKKCIDSILSQDFTEFEVLLIDDCSTDNSLSIAELYESNERVVLIRKNENKGLSDTRNVGLARARGEYIIFIDSDDYIESGCLQKICHIINDNDFPDIVYTGFIEVNKGVYSKKFGYASEKNKYYLNNSFLKSELEKRTLYAPACFGVYKSKLLKQNSLFFKVGILHEDELWTPRVVYYAKSIYTSDYAFYNYVRRDVSITRAKDKTQNGIDLIQSCKELDDFFSNTDDPQIKKLIYNHIAMVYMKAISIGKLYRKEYRKQVDRFYPIKKTCFSKDRIKAIICLISLKVYCLLDRFMGSEL